MVSGFLCGTSSFPRDEDDYERQTRSADSSPKRSRSKNNNNSNNKNPYSTRGLDKFSSLLAEIEEKRQQIYSRVDPDEISLVRFVYSGDHDVKPIVVKAKPKALDHVDEALKQEKPHYNKNAHHLKPSQIKKLQSSKSMNIKEDNNNNNNNNNNNKVENEVKKKNKKMGYSRNLRIKRWKESVIILPMIFILILMFLVLFGKSFAIMCTSIGWYVIPTITNKNSSSNNLKTSMKKKDYAIRRLSEKKLTSSEGAKSFKSFKK